MSKKLTAASGAQGISVPTTLPKQPVLVKEIRNLLENEAVLPLGSATDTLSQIEALFKTLAEIAGAPVDSRSDHVTARHALMRIQTLCEMGAYLAADQGNYVDCMREGLADKDIPALLAKLGGES